MRLAAKIAQMARLGFPANQLNQFHRIQDLLCIASFRLYYFCNTKFLHLEQTNVCIFDLCSLCKSSQLSLFLPKHFKQGHLVFSQSPTVAAQFSKKHFLFVIFNLRILYLHHADHLKNFSNPLDFFQRVESLQFSNCHYLF